MTKVLHFEGFSDDTFGEIATREDHDNCASGEPIRFMVWSAIEGRGCVVFGQYCPEPAAGWLIGVAPFDRSGHGDDVPIPPWPMRIEQSEREYSPRLVIEAPDDTKVQCIEKAEDDD